MMTMMPMQMSKKWFCPNCGHGQIIFIDQKEKMPTWLGEKSKCKYHEFTKSREHGRYGLLLDVYDEE